MNKNVKLVLIGTIIATVLMVASKLAIRINLYLWATLTVLLFGAIVFTFTNVVLWFIHKRKAYKDFLSRRK